MSLAEQFRQEGREETRSLAEQFRQEGRQEGREKGREEGLIFSKQQDILEALEIRFQRVPEGLREEIEAISDSKNSVVFFALPSPAPTSSLSRPSFKLRAAELPLH